MFNDINLRKSVPQIDSSVASNSYFVIPTDKISPSVE